VPKGRGETTLKDLRTYYGATTLLCPALGPSRSIVAHLVASSAGSLRPHGKLVGDFFLDLIELLKVFERAKCDKRFFCLL
jgi:hypothetical protein